MSGGVVVSSDNVEVNVVVPENGNVKFTVSPTMGNGEQGMAKSQNPSSSV